MEKRDLYDESRNKLGIVINKDDEILDMIKKNEFFKSHGKLFMDIINDNYCKKMIKML